MRARSNSNTAMNVVKHADPNSEEYRARVAIPVMDAIDSMPTAYRSLVNEFGYVDVYRAWKCGILPDAIKQRAALGGFFVL